MPAIAVETLRVHPRVEQQGFAAGKARPVLDGVLAKMAPFRGRSVAGGIAVLDWDHRLPSKSLTLRLQLCYEANTLKELERALESRAREIAARDEFPEFDVPDFVGLPGDESYDVELSPELEVEGMRLVSAWRRDIDDETAARAVAMVRGSPRFEEVKRGDGSRPSSLGDLEAVAWTPPCESGHARWTLDVWWLTSFDGRIGKGWSFLVDPASDGQPIVAAREFSVRAG